MNKLIAVILLSTATMLAAEGDTGSKAPRPANLPGTATANADGTWSYKDKDGVKWIYTNTPFGVSRARAADNSSVAPALPKGAVQNPDGTYSSTDKDGKKWIYTNTPFGLSRRADTGVAEKTAVKPGASDLRVIDKGETVRFERKGPMGNSVWEKKKSELSDEERRIYESTKPKPE